MKNSFTFDVPAHIDSVVAAYRTTDFFLATLKHAGAITIEILEERPLADEGRYWKAKISESSRVPQFLRASDLDIYINESAFDPPSRKLSWQIRPNFSAGRFSLKGEIAMVEHQGATQLNYSVDLHVKIPLIGPSAEALGLKKIRDEFRNQAEFLTYWLETHKANTSK